MSELFLKTVNMSISASWLVLAVLVIRPALKRAPKWVNVLLWGIVAVRLLCPFSFESALSLIPSAETIPLDIGLDTTPAIHSGIASINSTINPIISQSNTPHPGASVNPLQITIGIYENIWILGMVIMALYATLSYLRLRRKVETAVLLRDHILQSEHVSAPFLLGIMKPKIYLPFSVQEPELTHVIAHEQAHIERKDHWWKPLGFLLLTIHWFNPLMWAAFLLLCRDIELACDEKVISELGHAQRADYTQALLECSIHRRMIAACPLAFGEVGVKERVKNVMRYRKPSFWIILIAIIVCLCVAVCFLTNPPMPSLEVLPLVHSHSYGWVEMTYESPAHGLSEMVGSRFRITENMELGIKSANVSYTDWIDLGTLTGTTLTKENFDRLFYHDAGWNRNENAADIRKNAANVWKLEREDLERFYYLIQMKNGELFLAAGYYDTTEKNSPGSDDTAIGILYRIAVDLNEDHNIIARSGDNAASVTIFPAGTAVGNYAKAVHWLTIDPGEDFTPFRIYQNGEEVIGYYFAYDAETYEKLPYMVPSGLDPQTYLFQQADPNREYIVGVVLEAEQGADIYCFGVRFADPMNSVLQAKVVEIHDGYLLVQPVPGSLELNSADLIEVPMENMEASPEPEAGDLLRIEYDGYLLETYPARIAHAISIRVLQDVDSDALVMIPTTSRNEGIFSEYLYLTMDDGKKYRYELRSTMPDGIQAGEWLDIVYEDTGLGHSYQYTVFSVKGCKDDTQVLVQSEHSDSLWLYTYSPAKAVSADALQNAKDSGFVVMEDGDVTCGQEQWLDFYRSTQKGTPATIKLAYYYTLDPTRCSEQYYEAYKEDMPSLFLYTLQFDGSRYHLSSDSETEPYSRNFQYLMRYIGADLAGGVTQTVSYVLTQDDSVTWQEIVHGLLSSQAGAGVDHYTVYSDKP